MGDGQHPAACLVFISALFVLVIKVTPDKVWLGGIKNIDLGSAFGVQTGSGNTVAASEEEARVAERRITVRLKECNTESKRPPRFLHQG